MGLLVIPQSADTEIAVANDHSVIVNETLRQTTLDDSTWAVNINNSENASTLALQQPTIIISSQSNSVSINNDLSHTIVISTRVEETPPPAVADKHYTHTQSTAASIWQIVHNLGKVPAITVVSSNGNEIIGETQIIDNNQLQLVFSKAVAGTAWLN